MSEVPRSIQAYDDERSKRYDEHSALVWGGRERQRAYLRDLLKCLPQEPAAFLDLGCGTGLFTEVIFEAFPDARGVAVDGSEAMLERARERFQGTALDLTLRCELIQQLDSAALGTFPLVFCGLVAHHLPDDQKRVVLEELFNALEPGGYFVLFDSFRPEDPTADSIVEMLSCLKIQKGVEVERGELPPLDRIIARDRELKVAEGDQEASIEQHLSWLREIGFRAVTSVFQDDRIAGIVAIKPE